MLLPKDIYKDKSMSHSSTKIIYLQKEQRFTRTNSSIGLFLRILIALTFIPLGLPATSGQAFSTTVTALSEKADDLKNNLNGTLTGPSINSITTNAGSYPGDQIPRYEKLEISFQVSTQAANMQLPFDAVPPPGLAAGIGISVDALISPDNWHTIYKQPAFYFQEFDDQIKSGSEWYYPTGKYYWKVRFSPNQTGSWQYKIRAQDAGGVSETAPQGFSVVPSSNKGFLRVSPMDSRYFQFEDGTYFPGLSYNMNFDHIGWNNPILDNQSNFQKMSENGIQMTRLWLSEWGIYGPSWNPWNSIDSNLLGQYIPESGITLSEAYPGSDVSMEINSQYNPCMFLGFLRTPPAVKRNTTYHIRIRYKTTGLSGPRDPEKPYGFVAKTGGWLWDGGGNCNNPGTGLTVTPYQSLNTSGWQILEGSLNSGDKDFLPYFYLVTENVNSGKAFIDYVDILEDLGGGKYGPNIVTKPWMAQHLYMEQRNSYAFDKVLDLATANGIYLRPVIMEKNDVILNQIDFQGAPIPNDSRCWDTDPNNNPAKCPDNNWFYGNSRLVTKVRWLQQAWWRYLQARWGYSTYIHSWELLNEGDPYNQLHYSLADEFAKYMHQFTPNNHLVSTSFWHSFPKNEFWSNPQYQNVDFADYHQYIGEETNYFIDTVGATLDVSLQYGARQSGGAGKPVIRGETGFINSTTWEPTSQFQKDNTGIWLHNFIWGGINAGGLIESYWFENFHIYKQNSDKTMAFDFRPQYRTYYNFINSIPLNNGNYQDALAQSTNNKLRILGQKDLKNGRAHLWIQNIDHTWESSAVGASIAPISATVKLTGFRPNQNYQLQWCDTYQVDPAKQVTRRETILSQPDGSINAKINNLISDIGLKIEPTPAIMGKFKQFIPLLNKAVW
jgi:hypothetical protein